MQQSLSELVTKDPTFILHPASSITAPCKNGPQIMVPGKGCDVVDVDDRAYLDAVASRTGRTINSSCVSSDGQSVLW